MSHTEGYPLRGFYRVSLLLNLRIHCVQGQDANALVTMRASFFLTPTNFIVIGQANVDAFGNWQFEDENGSGLAKRFYKATYP